jgi:hypothetical protein
VRKYPESHGKTGIRKVLKDQENPVKYLENSEKAGSGKI